MKTSDVEIIFKMKLQLLKQEKRFVRVPAGSLWKKI